MARESFDNENQAHSRIDGEEDAEDALSEHTSAWQQLSHEVFVPAEGIAFQGHDPAPHVAAYKISVARRAAQVAFTIIACCLCSGIIWGFAALKPILIAKDLRLNLFFVSAATIANVSTLFAGATLDHAGRHVCYLISSALLALGCIVMGSAFVISKFDGYLLANLFLGVGGIFLFVPSFQLANAFPMHSGVVVALITGAFDSSAAVFWFYRIAYDASGGHFLPSSFFFGYVTVPALVLISELTFMPLHAYHTTPELETKITKAQDETRDVHDSDDEITSDRVLRRVRSLRAERRNAKLDQIEDLMGDIDERQERSKLEEEREAMSGVWGTLHGVPAHKQILTPWFILILLLTILQMLRMNYFIATIRSQYRFMLKSEDEAKAINHFFDAALPIAGVVSMPFIGLLLNKLSVLTALSILTLFIAAIGTLNCLPFVSAGHATVVAFVVFRPLYYSVMSDYVIKVFGFETFGRIYGTIICISGLVNFAQPGLDTLTHGPLHNDPTLINVTLAVAGTFTAACLTGYVGAKGKELTKRQDLKQAADEGRRFLHEDDEVYGTTQ